MAPLPARRAEMRGDDGIASARLEGQRGTTKGLRKSTKTAPSSGQTSTVVPVKLNGLGLFDHPARSLVAPSPPLSNIRMGKMKRGRESKTLSRGGAIGRIARGIEAQGGDSAQLDRFMGTYTAAVDEIREMRLDTSGWTRAEARKGGTGDLATRGPFVRKDVETGFRTGGLVQETAARTRPQRDPRDERTADIRKELHVEEAKDAEPPSPHERAAIGLGRDTIAAIAKSVELGTEARGWRNTRQEALKRIARSLDNMNAALKSITKRPGTAERLDRSFGDQATHIAFQSALIDGIGWEDTEYPWRMLTGFPVLGEIPDSKIFRQLPRGDAEREEFQKGFNSATDPTEMNNRAQKLADMVVQQGRKDRADAEKSELAALLMAKCVEEQKEGLSEGPFTASGLDKEYGRGRWWAMRRSFAIKYDDDGQRVLRMIDDGRSSGHNKEGTPTFETVRPTGVDAPALMAAEFLRQAEAQGKPCLPLTLSTDDVKKAYRKIPTSQPNYTCVCVYNPETDSAAFFVVRGHNFGLTSAVPNFNRSPALVCAATRILLAAPVDHFVDDFNEMDIVSCGASVQDAVWCVSACIGVPLAKEKRVRPGTARVILGVMVDVSRVHSEGTIVYSPMAGRCSSIITALQRAQELGILLPGEASKLFGRIQFLLSATFSRVGRAAALPLVERSVGRDGGTPCTGGGRWAVTEAYTHMVNFFTALLSEENLPVRTLQLTREVRQCALLYTDASYELGVGRLGIIIIDEHAGVRLFAGCVLPPNHEWMRFLTGDKRQCISQLEALAGVAALLTFGRYLTGRRTIHFIDNTAALSAFVHGYTSRPDMAVLSNAYHVLLAQGQIDMWLEWVPSEANPSDIPSRPPGRDWYVLSNLGLRPTELALPTVEQCTNLRGLWGHKYVQ